MQRKSLAIAVTLFAASAATACSTDRITDSRIPSAAGARYGVSSNAPPMVVNVSDDTTAQNETPLAVNPRNPQIMITGSNDWNYNDGCGVNSTADGGRTWTKTLPNGFIPGITRYTNDPTVPGTGSYDYGGDPAVGFSADGQSAYFACFGYQASPPFGVVLLLNRSTDGGVKDRPLSVDTDR